MPPSQNPYHLYVRLQEIGPLRERESDWVGEAVYRCGFAAVELSVALLEATAADDRPYIPQRDRKVHLVDAIAAQLALVARGLTLEPGGMARVRRVPHPARESRLLEPARLRLGELATRLEDGIRRGVAELPPGTGLDPVLLGRRDTAGLAEPPAGYLPYDEWVHTRDLWSRASADPYVREDLTFRTIHQTMECWFQAMTEVLRRGEHHIARRDWATAAAFTSYIAELLHYLSTHIRFLDYMDLSDYHPLRVALKSASGAQSEGAGRAIAEVRRQYELFSAARPAQPSMARVLERPAEFTDEYLYIDSLGRLESAFSDFLHSHYYRAVRVQSRGGLGSLGKGIDGLLERAVRPLYPEIDQARFEHLLFNNWLYAPVQGTLVEEMARSRLTAGRPAPLDAGVRQLAVEKANNLVVALRGADRRACAGLFDPKSGCVWDHSGTRAYRGASEIGGYFESVFQSLRFEEVRLVEEEWVGDRLVRQLHIDLVAITGKPASLPARWELEFDGQLAVCSLTIDWDTASIARLMIS